MAVATALRTSLSPICNGWNSWIMTISSRSDAASSGRPPASKAAADSSRCLIILASSESISSSPIPSRLTSLRLAMSRSFRAARRAVPLRVDEHAAHFEKNDADDLRVRWEKARDVEVL